MIQICKCGDSLAVRLPGNMVEALDLKEGDEVKIEIADDSTIRISVNNVQRKALAQLRALSRPLPTEFRFSRVEANERNS